MTFKDIEKKQIHFIGVGGIGMSGLALLLNGRGICVSGSDQCVNGNTERLQEAGVQVFLGHETSNLDGKDIVVISTDIKEGNPEYAEARARGIPILHRSNMLAILTTDCHTIAISGTHGKTTTTALTGWVFEKANLDPTVINGGVMKNFDSNVKAGASQWCIAESDESDGSFLKIPREIALITNIDPDHMDYYESEEKLFEAFETFATASKVAVLGIDHPEVYRLWQKIKATVRCITYGLHPEADVRAEAVGAIPYGSEFEILRGDQRFNVRLALHGQHNVLNALGVAAVAFECGIDEQAIKQAFSSFEGVDRRFTHVGDWQGVTIIDDYAHHPVEIRATLSAARKATEGSVIAVLEPHRYSRLDHHFEEFTTCCESADMTIVLPVYGSREAPREGINHEALAEAMTGNVYRCDRAEDLHHMVHKLAKKGDMVICLGAGSISSIAHALPLQLNQKDNLDNNQVVV